MVSTMHPNESSAPYSGVLLIVSESEERSRQIESHLRNAGHPMRAAWVADIEELEDVLRRGAPDVLLCSDAMPDTPVKDVLSLCAKLAPELPVLALGSALSLEESVAVMALGARDLVSDDSARVLRHLELACIREFVAHQSARELKATQLRLRDFESRHLQLLEGTADAVIHIQEGILSHVNPAFAQLLAYPSGDELAGTPLMDLVSREHQPKVKEHLKLLNKGKVDGKSLDCDLQRHDGSSVHVSAQLTRGSVDGENFVEMLIRAESGPPMPVALPGDSTSGRLALFQALAAASQPGSKLQRGALLLAVDNFIGLEERLGFEDSELVMLHFAQTLREQLTPQDSVFRFSTHEYVVLISRPTASEVEQAAESLCGEMARQIYTAHEHEANLTVSVAGYPLGGSETPAHIAGELVRCARKLATQGGNRYQLIGPSARANAEEREDTEKAIQIRKAIEENRLKLAYQSIASLEGDSRQHFDVLVRMIDETGRELHAAEFIKTAAKFNLMRAIDRWVITRGLKVLAKREGGRDASMLFIKLSEDTLKEAESLLAWLAEVLKSRPLKNEEICFEIQELVLQNHIRKAKLLSKGLRDLGAGIAIEHYGIGSNSTQLLDHVPATFLKFHSSYTLNFNEKDIQRKMTTLMEVAKQRGIKTIVSHVEDANIMARMWQMGINYIQGYHVQEPEVVLLSADPVRS